MLDMKKEMLVIRELYRSDMRPGVQCSQDVEGYLEGKDTMI